MAGTDHIRRRGSNPAPNKNKNGVCKNGKNLRLIVQDELGDSYCFEAFRVPEAETLTRDEVEAFKSVLFSRVSDRIPTESNG